MRYRLLPNFTDQLATLPTMIQKKFWKQLGFLLSNITHPSLHAKKYNETDDTWQARIDRRYRFYFKIEGDAYLLITIKRHAD